MRGLGPDSTQRKMPFFLSLRYHFIVPEWYHAGCWSPDSAYLCFVQFKDWDEYGDWHVAMSQSDRVDVSISSLHVHEAVAGCHVWQGQVCPCNAANCSVCWLPDGTAILLQSQVQFTVFSLLLQ